MIWFVHEDSEFQSPLREQSHASVAFWELIIEGITAAARIEGSRLTLAIRAQLHMGWWAFNRAIINWMCSCMSELNIDQLSRCFPTGDQRANWKTYTRAIPGALDISVGVLVGSKHLMYPILKRPRFQLNFALFFNLSPMHYETMHFHNQHSNWRITDPKTLQTINWLKSYFGSLIGEAPKPPHSGPLCEDTFCKAVQRSLLLYCKKGKYYYTNSSFPSLSSRLGTRSAPPRLPPRSRMLVRTLLASFFKIKKKKQK